MRWLLALLFSISVAQAQAQAQSVQQSGSVTPGHAAVWTTNGIIQDGGTAANGFLTSLGIINNGGPAICANSAPVTGPYNQLCFAVSTAAAATISLQSFGGAANQSLNFNINGISFPFPGALSQIIVGTTPVSGGSNGSCLFVNGAVVGQQACALSSITALTGDVTATGPGSVPATLATVNTAVGTWGSTSAIPVITVNGKGLITNVSTAAVATTAAGSLTGTTLAANVVNSSLIGLGTVTVGTWNANVVQPTFGGTGINNGSSSLTLAASLVTTGAGAPTLAFPGSPFTYTFQGSSDTIVGRATTDTLTNKTLTSPTINAGALSGTFSGTPTLSGANFVTLGNIVQDAVGYSLLGNTTAGSSNYAPFTIGGLTQKATPGSNDLLLLQDVAASGQLKFATVASVAAGATVASVNTATGAVVLLMPPQGRLTLQTATPVMTTTQANKATIFYDCYLGNQVPYFNSTNDAVDVITSCEVSTAMQSSSTGVINSGGVFDVWWWHNSGSPVICVATNGSGGGWASDTGGSNTARGTGYSQLDKTTRPYITNKNTIAHCYGGSTDYGAIAGNQATYLGTFFSTAAGQTSWQFGSSAAGGGAALLYLYNFYNRVDVDVVVTDSNATWNYGTATIRPSDAGGTGSGLNNRVSFVMGAAEDSVATAFMDTANLATSGAFAFGLALDGTTAFDKRCLVTAGAGGANVIPCTVINKYNGNLGVHFLQALEQGDSATTTVVAGTIAFAMTAHVRM